MNVNKIIVACDSGIVTSAIVASLLERMLHEEAVALPVSYFPLDQVEEESKTLLVIQQEMKEQADKKVPHMEKYLLKNVLDKEEYRRLIDTLKS